MGYTCHHTIVVTGSYGDYLRQAREKAVALFGRKVSSIVPADVNLDDSFFIGPDGSEEGWPASAAGDAAREEFRAWLRSLEFIDGSSPLSWVEVRYGDDDLETAVVADSDETLRGRAGREGGMIPRCATCRYWHQGPNNRRNDMPFGNCRNPAVVVDTEWKSNDDLRPHTASVLLNAEGQTPVFEVGRDFGCVHHEPPEEATP